METLSALAGVLKEESLAAKKQRPSRPREPTAQVQRGHRLVVVGAGFAGLSAARTVQAAAGDSVEVIVLEAGHVVGGRARSGKLPCGAPVEMGATWFHGIHGNPLYEIAVWEGLIRDLRGDPDTTRLQQVEWQVEFARPHAAELMTGRFRQIAEEALETFQQSAMELSEGCQKPDASVGAFLRRKFDEAVESHNFSEEELAVFAESWLFREKQQRSFDGFFCSDDVSTAFPWEFEALDGPNMPVPGGLQAIAESLAAHVDVRLGHCVTAIEWGSGGVCISCSNGAQIEADAVLVTTAIGVLQAQHEALFAPPLPDWKQVAISAMRLGVVDKIFVEWELEPDQCTVVAQGLSCLEVSLVVGSDPHVGRLLHEKPVHLLFFNIAILINTSSFPSLPFLSIELSLPSPPLPFLEGRPAAGSVADAVPAPMAASCSAEGTSSQPGSSAELWNMGRRLGMDPVAVEAAQAAAVFVLDGGAPRVSRGSRDRLRRLRRPKLLRTYAFMWPVPEPLALGALGSAEAQVQLPGGLPYIPLPGMPLSDLPSWLCGLHAIRFSPGPCWIEPSEQEAFERMISHDEGRAREGPATISAVLWIAGEPALEMEALPEEEVLADILTLLQAFPSIPLPHAKRPPRMVRSRWGRDELFRGSYSYLRAGVEDGEAIDAIAEPLCAADGMPVVMFAGEATHRQYPGTAHGAYMSGFREAKRFLSALDQVDSLLAWSKASAKLAAAKGKDARNISVTSPY